MRNTWKRKPRRSRSRLGGVIVRMLICTVVLSGLTVGPVLAGFGGNPHETTQGNDDAGRDGDGNGVSDTTDRAGDDDCYGCDDDDDPRPTSSPTVRPKPPPRWTQSWWWKAASRAAAKMAPDTPGTNLGAAFFTGITQGPAAGVCDYASRRSGANLNC